LVNCLNIRGRCVGSDLVQHLVKLRAQGVGRNGGADRNLNEGCGDTVQRRTWLDLSEAEVDLGLDRFTDFELLHIGDNADNAKGGESAGLPHRDCVTYWILAGEVLLREGLVDDDHWRRGCRIIVGEEAPADHWYAERIHQSRRGYAAIGKRVIPVTSGILVID